MNSELLKGYLEFIILSFINLKDMYGYEITKEINQKNNNLFDLKESTVYLILKRLQKKELLEGYWKEEDGFAVKRKYYRLTEKGQEYLKLQKREIKDFTEFIKKII